MGVCQDVPHSTSCSDVFTELRNPYYIGDHVGLTQTSGWLDGWTSTPSVYAVVARQTADVVAAVNFAREHHLRLAIKGGGHSYQGTSNAADSLVIWTREMHTITLHDAVVGQGCEGQQAPQHAVTVEAGALWLATYDAVTTRGGRYVLNLLFASLTIPPVYCHINSFRRVSSGARPEHGGENRTAVWASHHEELCSDGIVAPHGFAPLVGPHLGVALERCDLPGAAGDAGLDAALHARRAERTADGGVVSVPRVLHGSPRAPRINAQRVARFAHYCTHKGLLAKELCRSIQ